MAGPGAPDTPIEILLSVGADGEKYGSRARTKDSKQSFFWFWEVVFPVSGCTKYPDHEWDKLLLRALICFLCKCKPIPPQRKQMSARKSSFSQVQQDKLKQRLHISDR